MDKPHLPLHSIPSLKPCVSSKCTCILYVSCNTSHVHAPVKHFLKVCQESGALPHLYLPSLPKQCACGLLWLYKGYRSIYVRDNVSNHGHYREISPDRANRTLTSSVNDRRRSIHYPAYYMGTYQNEWMSFYNLFVTSIRSVDQQSNSPPKTSLSNRVRWGWSVTGLHAEWYERRDFPWQRLLYA